MIKINYKYNWNASIKLNPFLLLFKVKWIFLRNPKTVELICVVYLKQYIWSINMTKCKINIGLSIFILSIFPLWRSCVHIFVCLSADGKTRCVHFNHQYEVHVLSERRIHFIFMIFKKYLWYFSLKGDNSCRKLRLYLFSKCVLFFF